MMNNNLEDQASQKKKKYPKAIRCYFKCKSFLSKSIAHIGWSAEMEDHQVL